MGFNMYVYILNSGKDSNKFYTGVTRNLRKRLEEHNNGKCIHTSKYHPWKVITAVWFEGEKKAYCFEKYLKSGSGRAFAKKHFWILSSSGKSRRSLKNLNEGGRRHYVWS